MTSPASLLNIFMPILTCMCAIGTSTDILQPSKWTRLNDNNLDFSRF